MLPDITKTIPCLKCAVNTEHKLTPTELGCGWCCTTCGNTLHAYTQTQMQDVVIKAVFGITTNAAEIPNVPSTLQVFLEHKGPEAVEKEASRDAILQHVVVTRQLPEAGKPMFAKTSSGTVVPYGKVIRVVLG